MAAWHIPEGTENRTDFENREHIHFIWWTGSGSNWITDKGNVNTTCTDDMSQLVTILQSDFLYFFEDQRYRSQQWVFETSWRNSDVCQ